MHLPRLRRTRPRPSNRFLLIWAVLAWVLVPAGLFAGESANKPVFEEWAVLQLEGKQCGFGSTITTETDTPSGPQFQTEHVEEFVVKRMGIVLKITETSKVTEDADGGVLSFEETMSGPGSDITSSGVRDGDDLVVTGRGQSQRYHIPRLDALGPEKVRQLTLKVPLKAGQTFSFNTFAPEYPQSVVVEKGTIQGQETRNVRGSDRLLWKMTDEVSVMPGMISTAWVDDQGNDVEALTAVPGLGDLDEYVADRAECMQQPDAPEVFASSLIRPDHAIPSPRDQAQAVYRLTSSDISRKLMLWDAGEQRVLSTGPGTCEIEVTNHPTNPDDITWQLPHADTPELHQYLQASSYLEVNALEIQDLARQAVGDEKNPVKAAHRIQSFVRRYITKKDLNIGFASALETAKSREGDCTEHAVLCAALGRAAGLPTRCVVGLGYIPPDEDAPAVADSVDPGAGIFGFHMWAEAWVGPDQWVPMDAALGSFDVGHVAIVKSALEEINPLVDLNAPILQMMNDLKIEVVKTVPKGQHASSPPATPVPSTSPPSNVD